MLIKYTISTNKLLNTPFPLTLQIGDVSYLLQHGFKLFTQNLKNHERLRFDLNNAEDYANMLRTAKQQSLFSANLIIHGTSRKKTLDAAVKTQLLDYLKNPATHTIILLTLPEVSSKLIKEFIDNPKVLVLQTVEPGADAQKKWIFTSLCNHFKTVNSDVVASIFYFLEGNLDAIAAKIEEIALLFAPDHNLTVKDVEPLLIEQTQLKYADFVMALLKGTSQEILRFISYFKQNSEELTLLMWVITQEIRALIALHFALQDGVSLKNACFSLKLWSSREQAYSSAIKRLTVKQLYFMLHQAKLIDDQIKSFNTVYLWEHLETLTLKFSS